MDKIKMVKSIGKIVVSLGVGAVVNNAIKATTPDTMGKLGKLGVWVGGLVLVGMVSDAAETYVENGFDRMVDQLNGNVVDAEEV